MLSKERIEQLVAMAKLDGLCECANTRNAIELAVKESEAEAQARVVVALDQLKLDLMLENERMPSMTKLALDKFEQALASTDTTSIVQTETAFSHAYKTLQPEAKIISDVVARAAAKEKK